MFLVVMSWWTGSEHQLQGEELNQWSFWPLLLRSDVVMDRGLCFAGAMFMSMSAPWHDAQSCWHSTDQQVAVMSQEM